ncbi:MAG: glycosyltransferase family 4 protein [candidate division WOR-3 bacterium]
MKILQVSDSYYPDPGGVSEVLYHLTKALRDRGNEVHILTGGHPDAKKEKGVTRLGKRISLRANKSEINWTFSSGLFPKVKRFIGNNSFDIIHTHGPFAPNISFLALLYSDVVNVATFHTAFSGFNYYKLSKLLFTPISKKIDGSICVSKHALKEVYPHFPKGNYKIIPNGVDTSRFNPEGGRLKEFSGKKVILFLGRLDPRKGLPVMLKAFPLIKKEIPDAILLVAGKGVPPENIPEKFKNSIIFKGMITNEMVPVYYRSANLYCSPALYGETFGIVLLEAMACGTPVIASDIDGYREVIPDKKMLFERGDPTSLADKAISILKRNSEAGRIGKIGLETAKKYDWQNVAEKTEDFYRTLLKARKKA